MSQPKKLSPSWVETTDPNSGKVYYANVKTQETSWVRPTSAINAELAAVKNKGPKEDKWLERQDPNTGRFYYYNPARRETSWHRPGSVVSTGVASTNGAGQWVERQDPRTGRPYFYNPVLQKTSWHNPEKETDPAGATANALKRLSAQVGALGGIGSRLSFGGAKRASLKAEEAKDTNSEAGGNRNSARFSLATPALPVNKAYGRMSLNLGGDRFAALRAMQTNKPETVITTAKQPNAEEALKLDLRKEINEMQFDQPLLRFADYGRDHFNTRKKGMFGSSNVSLDALLRYSKQNLKSPLHSMKDKNLVADALLANKLILFYTGEKRSTRPGDVLAAEFASIGISSDPLIQGELYAQLIKHTTGNPDVNSVELGFELLAVIAGCFQPSPAILPYVKSHLKSAAQTPATERAKDYASYAMLRIERTGTRLAPPSLQEIAAVRSLSAVELSISMISANPVTMQLDSWTTVDDVRKAVETRFGIQDGGPFALFETSGDDSERVLDGKDNLLDVISYWETEGTLAGFGAMYKLRLYFDINESDQAALELAYLQAVYEVLDQRYPCERKDATYLAALELQEKFGDYNSSNDVIPKPEDMQGYLPPKFYDVAQVPDLKREIYTNYATFRGFDKRESMATYLNYVKQWPLYGSMYYLAAPVQLKVLGKEFPATVIIGINAKGVLILDPPTLLPIVEYPFSELVTWGFSPRNFVLVVGNLVRSTKLFFDTQDGQEMNSMIHAYVNKLMEAQTDAQRERQIANAFHR